MQDNRLADGVIAGRQTKDALADAFSDLHPPLDPHEALVAADRCYFCYDAPCMTACPTSIDIPMFIRQIDTGNVAGAAKTIFDQNILGGMCARVCPTETLCEQACVREAAEGKPVQIGLLQRYATDYAMDEGLQFYERAADTGKKVAVVGAGPAGLACAHRLSMHGHTVTIFEARQKPGGLNEYGIAAYKAPDDFAQDEVDYVLEIGGIDIEYGKALGRDMSLDDLKSGFDAVFLGIGMADVNRLGLQGAGKTPVIDAVEFIAGLRQSSDKTDVPVGRRVVVIGGGMTAVDCAVQAKLLGAEEVTICYRRGAEQMNASPFEQDLAATQGVTIRHFTRPVEIGDGSITLEYTAVDNGKLVGTGKTFSLNADQVFTAIGQTLNDEDLADAIVLSGGKIAVDTDGKTSVEGVWAGGDCTGGGEDLTVTAVAQGRDAAMSIIKALAQ